MLKIGTPVIWLGNNNDTLVQVIKQGTVTRVGKDVIWVNHQHKAEDCLMAEFVWPDEPRTRLLLETTLALPARHRQELSDLYNELYKLRNELVREGVI